MKDLLDGIHVKLDKIDDRLGSIDTTLVKQEVNLREHMRRTELLEKELAPIKSSIAEAKGVRNFLSFIIPTLIAAIVGLIEYLKK